MQKLRLVLGILAGSLLGLGLAARAVEKAKPLTIYFIDVEGGQATLIVSPSGQSMLVDTGWPDANGRDAERIVEAAKLEGVNEIDYLVVTHYHMDHVGGVPQLAARIPILNFVDHGPSFEHGAPADGLVAAYEKVRANHPHMLVKPGDKIPLRGLDVQVLTAAGDEISEPLPGAGQANPACATTKPGEPDPSENARSIGMLVTYGAFRFIDLGDLTWQKEYELACPQNKVGRVTVYLSTHHGLDLSGGPEIVHALGPLVAIMNNGARKGGSASALEVIHATPGLEDLWQLHYAEAAGKANAPDDFIANLNESPGGGWLKLTAEPDGSFAVTNSRNGKTKRYSPSR